MSFSLDGSGNVIVNSSGLPIDCAACPCYSSPCNASLIPTDLRLTIRYMLSGSHPKYLQAVTLSYNATACTGATPGWSYGGGDIEICPGFSIRALNLCCVSAAWNLELVVVNNGIQDDLQNPGSLANPTTVSSNPLHITSITNGDYSTPCGLGLIYIDIEEIAAVSPCCADNGLPSTATATFTIDGLAPETLNLTLGGNTYTCSRTCDVGDGHTQVKFAFISSCTTVFADWSVSFQLSKVVDGATVSVMQWSSGARSAGVIYTDFEVTCDPYQLHMAGLNTSGSTGGGTSQTCDGVTYPFATAGNVNLVLDIVTP